MNGMQQLRAIKLKGKEKKNEQRKGHSFPLHWMGGSSSNPVSKIVMCPLPC